MPVYTQSISLNDKAYDLPNQNWTPVGPAFKVTKRFNKTPIELEYSGGGTRSVYFRQRGLVSDQAR